MGDIASPPLVYTCLTLRYSHGELDGAFPGAARTLHAFVINVVIYLLILSRIISQMCGHLYESVHVVCVITGISCMWYLT